MTRPGTVGWDWAVRPQTEGASGWAGAKLQGRAWTGDTLGKVSRKGEEFSLGKFPFTVSSLHPQFSSRPEIPQALLLELINFRRFPPLLGQRLREPRGRAGWLIRERKDGDLGAGWSRAASASSDNGEGTCSSPGARCLLAGPGTEEQPNVEAERAQLPLLRLRLCSVCGGWGVA